MSAQAALQTQHNHTATDLALAHVAGGSDAAKNAANAILSAHASDMNLNTQRAVAVNDNMSKDQVAMFSSQFAPAAGLNFANITTSAEVKGPVGGPNVADKGSAVQI